MVMEDKVHDSDKKNEYVMCNTTAEVEEAGAGAVVKDDDMHNAVTAKRCSFAATVAVGGADECARAIESRDTVDVEAAEKPQQQQQRTT